MLTLARQMGIPIVEQALDLAHNFQPLNEAELSAVLAKSAPAAAEGTFELYKTTQHFDSTAQHPERLG